MNIYLSNTTNFNNNGLGFLKDCISAKVTEVLNGDYYLEFEYPTNSNMDAYLVEGNVVKCNVGNSSYQLFRIKKVTKDFSRVSVYAIHIFYDLLDNFVLNTYPKNLTANFFGEWILAKTNFEHSFTFYSDIAYSKTARYVRRNPVEIIMGDLSNSMVNLFGGEVERDNFNIKLLAKRGNNNGIKLIFGKNITSIKETIDISEMYTRVLPLGFDGLMLPETYVDSPLINNYITPKITKIEFSNIKHDETGEAEDAYTNIEDAYQALRDSVNALYDNGLDKPNINIKIDWIELSKTEEYKNYSNLEKVRLGDTVTANILDIDYTTRIVKTVYNVLTDTIDKFEIGTMAQSIVNSMNTTTQKIESIDVTGILDSAKTNATNLITSAMGGYIYKTQNELFIMDTNDPNTAQKVWRWNINGLGYSSTGINGTYGLAMTMDGQIVADFITTGTINTNRIQGYGDLLLEVHDLNEKIQDIADITVAEESENAKVELLNVNESEPITIKIHPINENICYLYPKNGLYPSNTLMLKNRKLEFHNKTTGEYFYWELPTNLWYYDSENYDEISWDYESETITVNRKCKINADDTVSKLATATTETYEFPLGKIALTTGNYEVSLIGYSNAYIYVRLMASNIYTTQFPTIVEMNSKINLTKEKITEETNAKFTNYTDTLTMQQKIDASAAGVISTVSKEYATKNTVETLSTTVSQTAGNLTSEIKRAKDSETSLSSLISQNADNITSEITDRTNADFSLSSRINQTVKSIDLTVSDNSTSAGINIKLKNEDGTQIDSKSANITMSGLVKFTDLSTSGSTTINGANITTGTINCNLLNGGTISGQTITGGTITGTTITGGSINISSGKFKVTSAGAVTASNLTITGGSIKYASLGSSYSTSKVQLGKFYFIDSGMIYNPSGSSADIFLTTEFINLPNGNKYYIRVQRTLSQVGYLHFRGNVLMGYYSSPQSGYKELTI